MRGLNKDLSVAISKVTGKPGPKAIHRLRTTIRRIESLVSYSHPDLKKKLERSLEKIADLRKRAGKVHDLDAQMDLLKTLGNGSTIRDRKILTAILEKKRARQVKRLESTINKIQKSKFFSRMEQIAVHAGVVKDGKDRPLAPLEEAIAQLAVMASDFTRHALKPSRMHEARVTLKRIRYLAELAEESAAQKDFIRELKLVQDAVGEWHDWQELTDTAEKRFSDRVNCALLREVRALLSARHSAATSAIQNLFTLALSPGRFTLVLAPGRKPPGSAQSFQTTTRSA